MNKNIWVLAIDCANGMPPHMMPHPSKKNIEVWEKHTLFRG